MRHLFQFFPFFSEIYITGIKNEINLTTFNWNRKWPSLGQTNKFLLKITRKYQNEGKSFGKHYEVAYFGPNFVAVDTSAVPPTYIIT